MQHRTMQYDNIMQYLQSYNHKMVFNIKYYIIIIYHPKYVFSLTCSLVRILLVVKCFTVTE